ncbi:uncharacterized protein LOC142505990 [Primulina tabacum]|uniref:uncharacterized protein LOC142505990 n=1 Tax=Primulina tabacum TaxID=48773 RepID=UPI003F5974BC
MNCAFPEMLRRLDNAGSITGNGDMGVFSSPIQAQGLLGNNGDRGLSELVLDRAMKQDPGVDTDWVLSYVNGSEFEMGCVVPRTAGCVQPEAAEVAADLDAAGAFLPEMLCSAVGRDGSKKRKADTIEYFKVDEEQSQDKKMNESEEGSSDKKVMISKSTKNEPLIMNSKVKTTVPDLEKTDYIHVRARRGQATDSHSLAERVRREKISERMKYLQDLVPGCNKIIGKAGLLDEIINYVQSLQRQVEFLSMKLAVINPKMDFGVDNLLTKEMLPVLISDIHAIAVSPDMVNPAPFQFNSLAQGVPFSRLETGVNPSDDTVERTVNAPVSLLQETHELLDSSHLNQFHYSNWDSELIHNLYGLEYQQERSPSYAPQPFTGYIEGGRVKLEM